MSPRKLLARSRCGRTREFVQTGHMRLVANRQGMDFGVLAGLLTAMLISFCSSEAIAAARFAFAITHVDRTSGIIQKAANINSTDKSTADEEFEPELSATDLANIEHEGGQSGIDCSIGRRTLSMVFRYRQMGTPLDEARDYVYNKSSGLRSNRFMWETVDEIYRNPARMQAMINNGHWSHACVKAIRGF